MVSSQPYVSFYLSRNVGVSLLSGFCQGRSVISSDSSEIVQ